MQGDYLHTRILAHPRERQLSSKVFVTLCPTEPQGPRWVSPLGFRAMFTQNKNSSIGYLAKYCVNFNMDRALDHSYLCWDNGILYSVFQACLHSEITQGPSKEILIPLTHWGLDLIRLEYALSFEIVRFLNFKRLNPDVRFMCIPYSFKNISKC